MNDLNMMSFYIKVLNMQMEIRNLFKTQELYLTALNYTNNNLLFFNYLQNIEKLNYENENKILINDNLNILFGNLKENLVYLINNKDYNHITNEKFKNSINLSSNEILIKREENIDRPSENFTFNKIKRRLSANNECNNIEISENSKKNENKPFSCSFEGCNKDFNFKWMLERHHNSHLSVKKFKCDFPNCGKSYKSKENVNLHMKNKHLGIKPYICDYCSSYFSHRNGKFSF